MKRKWIAKLGTPILALALMSACGTTNDNNDDRPTETDIPEDTNAPGNENPNNNNEDIDAPYNDVNNNNDRDQGIEYNNNNDIGVPNNNKKP